MSTRRTVKVDLLARVEGEGGLFVRLTGGQVSEVRLNIFEPPRFFEGFLRGRMFDEVPDITSRICGICPVAYQMSSVQAIEQALGVAIDPAVRELRRLLYCGEWIESHALHIYLLHAPDFLGYADAVALAQDHRQIVEKALELKRIGNHLMTVIGGREIHPVSVCVGGFWRVPGKADLERLVPDLERARDISIETARFVRTLEFVDFEPDYDFVALRHSSEYPVLGDRIVSSSGLDIAIPEFADHFEEQHMPHSNALHCVRRGHGPYLVGPLARFNLNFDRLPPETQALAYECGIAPPVKNPFRSIIVRAVETVWACEEAIRIISRWQPPLRPRVEVKPHASEGHGCTEAPRGMLYHNYKIGEDGAIETARIVPPTAQNLRRMEEDLKELVPFLADLPQEELTWKCEQAVRNYDPCISCATHFLKLTLERA